MKNVMKRAHEMAKEIKREYPEVDYQAQLGICLSYLYNEEKEEVVTIETVEKKAEEYCDTYQNGWYAKVNVNRWAKYGYDRTYIEIAQFRKGAFRSVIKCGYWDNIKYIYVVAGKELNLLEAA